MTQTAEDLAVTVEPTFRSDVSVELVKADAQDSDVLFAARVSTAGEQSIAARDEDAGASTGLMRYLMRSRHGCYDAATEVLTSRGWLRWPDVTGQEEFLTLSPDGRIEWQWAERLAARPVDGPMVRIRMAHVDLLVTPDHNLLAARRRQPSNTQWELVPARDLLEASHRLPLCGGTWHDGYMPALAPGRMALLGFFIGDGFTNGPGVVPSFRLRKAREIAYLTSRAAEAGFMVRRNGDRFTLDADDEFRLLAKKCYADDRGKMIPLEMLDHSPQQLLELLDGLWHSDGSVSPSGKRTFSTTSHQLAGQIQEIAVKTGQAALIFDHPFDRDPRHFGSKPRYRLTLYRDRNSRPRVGWTVAARSKQVAVEHYRGMVYCVTVPNGTLYVRRNGKPLWCGNSPFEHNSFTFLVTAPIFVFREFMRHRTFSYNEESGRYRELQPVFYVPARERRLVQQGKPGRYEFVDGTPEQHALVTQATMETCRAAYAAYQRMLDAGVAREVARIVLPLTTYSSMYATCNARTLMHFLSLRTKREGSTYPSYPQREIEMVAEQMEQHLARHMPITYDAFNAFGRVAP